MQEAEIRKIATQKAPSVNPAKHTQKNNPLQDAQMSTCRRESFLDLPRVRIGKRCSGDEDEERKYEVKCVKPLPPHVLELGMERPPFAAGEKPAEPLASGREPAQKEHIKSSQGIQ